MGKPFRLEGGQPRDAGGRFQTFQPVQRSTPPQIHRESLEKGISVSELAAAARVSDHATPKNDPTSAEEDLTPREPPRSNDANRKPYRF